MKDAPALDKQISASVTFFKRAVVCAALVAATAAVADAKLFTAKADALTKAFPAGTRLERRTAFLNDNQVEAAKKRARAPIDSLVWSYYVARSKTGVIGYAYFDRIIVRTLPATLMVSLNAEGAVNSIKILTFSEPEDYLPRRRWLDLFRGLPLTRKLKIGGQIHSVSGATLTVRAFTNSVRRVLALHEILYPSPQ